MPLPKVTTEMLTAWASNPEDNTTEVMCDAFIDGQPDLCDAMLKICSNPQFVARCPNIHMPSMFIGVATAVFLLHRQAEIDELEAQL